MVNSVLAINVDVVVSTHALLASSAMLGSVKVAALVRVGASGAAHLAALVESGGAVGRRSCRRASAELAVYQVVMSIVTLVSDSRVVGDACPNG